MKTEFRLYLLFSAPALLLLIAQLLPNANNFNVGGPWVLLGLALVCLVVILSPLLTVMGLILICKSAFERKSILPPCIGTIIAASSGIVLLILNHPMEVVNPK